MKIGVFHHPGFAAPIGQHVMPIDKFARVAEALRGQARCEILEPAPLSPHQLLRVHSHEYVDAIRSGEPRPLAESQKFPWSSALYDSVLLTGGGLLAAAALALDRGVAGALASGFHHAHADHGEGFCTFNSLVVAAEALRAGDEVGGRRMRRIDRIAVLDLDLHYGNGTASLARSRPWLFNLSIYGNDYDANTAWRDVSTKRHEDGANHRSIALAAGAGRRELLEAMEAGFALLAKWGRPDLLLYQAGADPYREDPYSPLDLDHDDLLARDRRAFEYAKSNAIPVAWVLAGGYTADVSKVVRVHTNTFVAAGEVFP
ncbi:MAG TPA: histone deacetylase [Candidatus Binatia bacterium]|jgi:acetoin utilization deacetylase AcuC-like enzyme